MAVKRQAANLTKQEKYEQFALQKVQQNEEKALAKQLKKSGFDKNQISQIIAKERQANAQELSGLRELQGSQAGYQASPYGDPFKGTVRSGMTFADTAPQIAQRIQAGYDYVTKVKAIQRFADKVGLPLGDAMRLSQLPTDRPVTVADVKAIGGAKHPAAVAKLANTLNSWGGGDIDASQLRNVKPVDGSPGVYHAKVKIRGGETVDGYFIRDEATGKYTNTENLYKHWNNKAGLGAFGIVLAAGIGLLAGPIGEALGSQIAGGAIAGAINAEIQGGDILKGALTGGVGAGINVLGQSLQNSIYGNLMQGGMLPELAKGIANVASSAAAGAVKTAIAGGDVLSGAALSGLEAGIQSSVSNALQTQFNIDEKSLNTLVSTASNAAAAGVVAAVQGQDIAMAVGTSVVQTVGGAIANGELFPASIQEKSTQAASNVTTADATTTLPANYWNMTASADSGTVTDVAFTDPSLPTLSQDSSTDVRPTIEVTAKALSPEDAAFFDKLLTSFFGTNAPNLQDIDDATLQEYKNALKNDAAKVQQLRQQYGLDNLQANLMVRAIMDMASGAGMGFSEAAQFIGRVSGWKELEELN